MWKYTGIYLTTKFSEDDISMLPLILSGRGRISLLSCRSAIPFPKCNVYVNEFISGNNVWTLQAFLTVPNIKPNTNFGHSADFDGNCAILGSPFDTSGKAYVFYGEWNTWTLNQVLVADDKYANGFGHAVDFIGDNALIGAFRDSEKAEAVGAVYSYFRVGKLWSQKQKLIPHDGFLKDNFGFKIRVFQDHCVIGATQQDLARGSGTGAVYLYHFMKSTSTWSFLQHFKIDDGEHIGTYYDFYGEYFVIGSQGSFPLNTMTSTPRGALYVYKAIYNATTNQHFSEIQILRVPKTSFYGSSVSLYGPYIFAGSQVVGGEINLRGGIYVHELIGSTWTQTQLLRDPHSFAPAIFVNPYLHGSYAVATNSEPMAAFFTSQSDWHCLLVTVADIFGDGWGDTMRLIITAPDGSIDKFAPTCYSSNPLTYRYCPHLPTDEGKYVLSIVGLPTIENSYHNSTGRSFHWEILYFVQIEGEEIRYKGNYRTEMIFSFISKNLSFKYVISAPTSKLDRICQPCSTSSSGHHHAIHSDVNGKGSKDLIPSSDDWHWFHMYGENSTGWYSADSLGINFYISDKDGKHLHSSGTMCPGSDIHRCWQHLKDGSYVLRIGGATYPQRHQILRESRQMWSFCGINGTIQQQLEFKIAGGWCVATSKYHMKDVCSTRGVLVQNLVAEPLFSSIADVTSISIHNEKSSFVETGTMFSIVSILVVLTIIMLTRRYILSCFGYKSKYQAIMN